MQTYPACGYGLVFTTDQTQPLFEKVLAVRHADEDEDMRPKDIYEVIDILNDESYDWFFIDNNSDSNFNATIYRLDKEPEDFNKGILYFHTVSNEFHEKNPTQPKMNTLKQSKPASELFYQMTMPAKRTSSLHNDANLINK